jgi:aspartyl-tRNA(Asn)/glutamyl-tRNA(Gln) amidotransferase subunit C
MTVDQKLIDQLAHLSRLSFDEETGNEMIHDLNRILSFVEKLSEVNTDGVEPLIYMVDETNVLREDDVKIDITQDEGLKNAPKKDSDYFRVPRFVDSE